MAPPRADARDLAVDHHDQAGRYHAIALPIEEAGRFEYVTLVGRGKCEAERNQGEYRPIHSSYLRARAE